MHRGWLRLRAAAPAFGELPTGRILRENHFDVTQDLFAQSHELQFITNLDGNFNFIGGLYKYYANTNQILDLYDRAHLGTFTDAPSYGLLAPTIATVFPNACQVGDGVVNGGVASCTGRWNGDPNGTYFYYDNVTEVDAFAAFGQAEWAFAENFELTIGLRYSEDEKEGTEERFGYFELPPAAFFLDLPTTNFLLTTNNGVTPNGDTPRLQGIPLSFADRLELDNDWDAVTWRINLDWTPTEDSLVYAGVTTGYRSGGFHLGLAQLGDYDQEEVIAYEAGYKGDFLDGRLRLNAAAYYYDYTDQQLRLVGALPGPGGTVITGDVVVNAPESENYGFELEWTWIWEDLLIGGLYSYMHTEITDDFFAVDATNPSGTGLPQNLKGNQLNRAPENKFSLWANYRWNLDSAGTLDFFTTYAFTDEQYHSLFENDIDHAPDYFRWDARLAWNSADGRWVVAGWVNNITDESSIRIINFSTDSTLFARTAAMSAPRSYGMELRYRFGAW